MFYIRAVSDVIWNGFLAVIPVGLAYLIARFIRREEPTRRAAWRRYLLVGLLGVLWLFFLPNTCYLLTEWRHYLNALSHSDIISRTLNARDNHAIVTLCAYSLAFLLYSLFGLFTFALGIRPIARLLRARMAHYWVLGIPFFPLMSLGVYLGLIHRFNSWDLLMAPGKIFREGAQAVLRPYTGMYILLFGLFLWGGNYLFDIWIDGFHARCAALRRLSRSDQ